ncbi:hypothetical protein EYB53_012130 [Candidatus Chloroploca sp. M-50]|uniref:Phosphoribulokinase/uridine kinase domain-containing protein n=1 Tax=Candidatus Chloroploca mongolica TaxID=2528176 RepID=A0ABS4DAI2_9CHLR|nr:hypothetical protein [Candidatus Chloroploca mongolica]MBP1466453.1 hypothetical protein [Candidatus Chloroploca mongolica]
MLQNLMHPDTAARDTLLQWLVAQIVHIPAAGVTRVALDGVDGAGKTMFADELAPLLASAGRRVMRASVDSFHHPRMVRYRLGHASPEGFYRDSYDYAQLRTVLLDPLSPGGHGRYRSAVFDHRVDAPIIVAEAQALPGDILVFDGIFLHRPELRGYWDYSIFLHVNVEVSVQRCAQRDGGSPDPHAPENRRYVEGQQIYLREATPHQHASVVINHNDVAQPWVMCCRLQAAEPEAD